jgi:uncharacterized protein
VLRLLAIGLVAGFFSALFGVGGGLVIVPLLILVVRFEERSAMGTSLAAIGITALVGTILYALHGKVEPDYAALVGLPAAAGAVLGTALQQRLRRRLLSTLFALLLAVIAVRLVLPPPQVSGSAFVGSPFGFAAGVLAGLFGVGGGILFVPTLLALGLSQVHAEATSLLAILPTVAAGTWQQRRYGNVRVKAALVIGTGSIAGVEGGVLLASSLPEHALRRLFAALMLAVALQIAWRARRKQS